jgi:toxin FitB
MIIVDTNVVSGIMADQRDPKLDAWLDEMDAPMLWLPTIVIFEIKGGIDVMPHGRRKRDLLVAFDRLLQVAFRERILPFDTQAAIAAAAIGAVRKARGQPAGTTDTQIAGIAMANAAALATRNARHFSDLPVKVIDPWAFAAE